MILHIIYTEAEVILSKKSYGSWREIQNEYSDFKASLGPWSSDEVAEYLSDEYSNIEPAAFLQVADFLQSTATIYNVKFHTKKDD